MFTITYEDEIYRHWSCEFIFEDFNEAKQFLLEKGFIEKNRIFERRNYNWCKYLKAYISPLKIYKK